MRKEVLLEAEFIKIEGGEIPEVYFWNSYFWLTENPPLGLGLELTFEELEILKKAVLERYLIIIKRDLTYENIGSSSYRGLERAWINLLRLKKFLQKENFPEEEKFLAQFKITQWLIKFKKDLEENGHKSWLKNEILKKLEKELKEGL